MRKRHEKLSLAGPMSLKETVGWFRPILDALRELGGSGTPSEVADLVAINEHVREGVLNSKDKEGESLYYKQIEWAGKYLIKEGLVNSSIRGTWELTNKGWDTKLKPGDARKILLKWVALKKKKRKEKRAAKNKPPKAVRPKERKWNIGAEKRPSAPMRQTRTGTGIIVNVKNTKLTETFSEERALARESRMYTTKAERKKINVPWSKWLPKVVRRKK